MPVPDATPPADDRPDRGPLARPAGFSRLSVLRRDRSCTKAARRAACVRVRRVGLRDRPARRYPCRASGRPARG